MAQTGYTPILIYSSTTASQAPAAGNLTNSTLGSELAINITDGKLFYKDNAGSVQVIAWKVTPTLAGGTGLTSYTAGDMLYYATGTTLSKLAIGTAYQMLGVNAGGTAPSWQPSATSVLTTQGDLLYASAANTLARLAKNTTASRYLSNSGTSNNPAWAQVDLTNGVTGVLPVANGGTNASSASITAFNNITGYTASGATGTTSTNLVFSTSPSITTPTLVGDATLSTGNLIQGTAAKGINFTANSAAAGMTSQLLNWYEEGTWTPTISFGGGSTGITYDAQSGWYTRIGNLVTVQCIVFLSNKGSSTGDVLISGLPFATTGNNYKRNGGYGFFDRVTPCQILTNSSATTFTLQTLSTGTGSSAATLTNTDFANNSYLSMSFSYFV